MKSAALRCHFLGKKRVSFSLLLKLSTGGVDGTMGEMHGHMGVASAGTINTEYLPDDRFELENGGQVFESGGDSQIQSGKPQIGFGALLPNDRGLAEDRKLQGDQGLRVGESTRIPREL
jgi:hypothetical protein